MLSLIMETCVLDLNDSRIVVTHDLLFTGAIRGSSHSAPKVSIIKLSCLATLGGQARFLCCEDRALTVLPLSSALREVG